MKRYKCVLSVLSIFYFSYLSADVRLVTNQNFDDSIGVFNIGSQNDGNTFISNDMESNFENSSGSLVAKYPVPSGGSYNWAVVDVSGFQTSELVINFRAKMPLEKHGLKFVKVYSGNSGGANYANTTFGLDYTGNDNGSFSAVSFGDGQAEANDTGNVILLDGEYPQWIGRSYGTAEVSTPQNEIWGSENWGSNWHHFWLRVKFNSGSSAINELADGEYDVQIDGKTYVKARKLFNRHYSNLPIDRVEFFGWSQSGSSPFEVWIDNVTVSTGAPKSPASLE